MLSTKKLLYKVIQKLDSPITKGYWTPKLADYGTVVASFTTDCGRYYDIGGVFRVFFFNERASSALTFNTVLEIRGDAMSGYTMVGGTLYVDGAANDLGDRTIQAASGYVLVRPNYTGTANAGWWSGWFLGINNSWI